jgi:hypothetical protein
VLRIEMGIERAAQEIERKSRRHGLARQEIGKFMPVAVAPAAMAGSRCAGGWIAARGDDRARLTLLQRIPAAGAGTRLVLGRISGKFQAP